MLQSRAAPLAAKNCEKGRCWMKALWILMFEICILLCAELAGGYKAFQVLAEVDFEWLFFDLI